MQYLGIFQESLVTGNLDKLVLFGVSYSQSTILCLLGRALTLVVSAAAVGKVGALKGLSLKNTGDRHLCFQLVSDIARETQWKDL